MKTTRMFEHAERHRLPVVCWLDGGGARPHDMKVEGRGATPTFVVFARLSGLVPTVGILPGRAFAGHAQPRRHVRRADRHQGFHPGHGRPAAG